MRFLPSRIALVLGLVLIGTSTVASGPEVPKKPEDLAKARLELVRRIYRDTEEQLMNSPAPEPGAENGDYPIPEQLAVWSRRWMEAERDLNAVKAARIVALEGHIKRLRTWEERYEVLVSGVPSFANRRSLDTLKFHRLEAEYWLAKEKAGK